MEKLFRSFKSGFLSIFSIILFLVGLSFLFNLYPLNNYVSYLISLSFFITGGIIIYNVAEGEE
jgi:uncharacterized protein YebE (UPF0316 family)